MGILKTNRSFMRPSLQRTVSCGDAAPCACILAVQTGVLSTLLTFSFLNLLLKVMEKLQFLGSHGVSIIVILGLRNSTLMYKYLKMWPREPQTSSALFCSVVRV